MSDIEDDKKLETRRETRKQTNKPKPQQVLSTLELQARKQLETAKAKAEKARLANLNVEVNIRKKLAAAFKEENPHITQCFGSFEGQNDQRYWSNRDSGTTWALTDGDIPWNKDDMEITANNIYEEEEEEEDEGFSSSSSSSSGSSNSNTKQPEDCPPIVGSMDLSNRIPKRKHNSPLIYVREANQEDATSHSVSSSDYADSYSDAGEEGEQFQTNKPQGQPYKHPVNNIQVTQEMFVLKVLNQNQVNKLREFWRGLELSNIHIVQEMISLPYSDPPSVWI